MALKAKSHYALGICPPRNTSMRQQILPSCPFHFNRHQCPSSQCCTFQVTGIDTLQRNPKFFCMYCPTHYSFLMWQSVIFQTYEHTNCLLSNCILKYLSDHSKSVLCSNIVWGNIAPTTLLESKPTGQSSISSQQKQTHLRPIDVVQVISIIRLAFCHFQVPVFKYSLTGNINTKILVKKVVASHVEKIDQQTVLIIWNTPCKRKGHKRGGAIITCEGCITLEMQNALPSPIQFCSHTLSIRPDALHY